MELKDDISVSSYMDTFFLCHVGRDKLCEKMVQEHTLFHLISGEMDVQTPEGVVRLKKGDTCFLRRNHRVDKEKRPAGGEAFNGIFLHLNVEFLKQLKDESRIAVPSEMGRRTARKNVFMLPRHPFMEGFFHSLVSYFSADQYPSKELLNSKLREAVFVLLQLSPTLIPVLFDFAAPYKIDLHDFMEENFRSDLTVEQFAHFAGRSLTSFKHDFNDIFHLTPQRWLSRRRLQEARRLMEEGAKANDIYLKVGFKNLSHFSTAFKKEYGIPPSKLKIG
jgi:AraC-type DNA-binding domain-containing proteins